MENGKFSRRAPVSHEPELHEALRKLKEDLPVAEFLRREFRWPRVPRVATIDRADGGELRRCRSGACQHIPVRDEWMDQGRITSIRIARGYGGIIDFLSAECRERGVAIQFRAAVTAVEASGGRTVVRCADGDQHVGDTAVLTVPPPILQTISLPEAVQQKADLAGRIGFGNVIKILLRFETRWWADGGRPELGDLTFLLSDEKIPVWWTQFPDERPVLTGWFAGPKTDDFASFDDTRLIDAGLASLAHIFRLPGNCSTSFWHRVPSTGRKIRSRAERIPTPPRRHDWPRRRSRTATLAKSSSRAKRSIAGGTWEPSRQP
jgi:flavin-dependent amine oxidoreductase